MIARVIMCLPAKDTGSLFSVFISKVFEKLRTTVKLWQRQRYSLLTTTLAQHCS